MRPVLIDFETQSGADLKAIGGRRYAEHCSTRVLCLGASWDLPNGSPVSLCWVPDNICGPLPTHSDDGTQIIRGAEPPRLLTDAVRINGRVCAHNADQFDRFIWDRFVGTPVREWVDTIHYARSAGYPAALDKLGEWLTGRGKDEAGQKLMKKLMTLEYDYDTREWTNKFTLPGSVASVVRYCIRDVDLLRLVYDAVTAHDAGDDAGIVLVRAINERGIGFDEDLAARIAHVSTQLVIRSGEEVERLTDGKLLAKDLRSIPKVKKWLESQGVDLKNLQRKTIESFIENMETDLGEEGIGLNPDILKVLRLRNSFLRVTGAKLDRASAACKGGRLYNLIVYYGSHTGRMSSRDVQVLNLPKGRGKPNLRLLCSECTLDNVMAEAERCKVLPDDVLSSMVRPTLVPSRGKDLLICDFNAIEARVLAWMAGQEDLLEDFRSGRDPYKGLASLLYRIPVDDVTPEQRAVGKVGVLGGGYGMGYKKVVDYAAGYGIDFAEVGMTPKEFIERYRNSVPKIAGEYEGEWKGRPYRRGGVWKDIEHAFKSVMLDQVGVARAGLCTFTKEGHSVIITLPSGRRLTYRKCRLEELVYYNDAGEPEPRPCIVYTSGRGDVITYGGKLTENIDQAISYDILRDAAIAAEGRGLPVVLPVHDELVCEVDKVFSDVALVGLRRIMSTTPAWAPGLPLSAEGFVSPRYVKEKW